jgi:hypothetical protein
MDSGECRRIALRREGCGQKHCTDDGIDCGGDTMHEAILWEKAVGANNRAMAVGPPLRSRYTLQRMFLAEVIEFVFVMPRFE